MTERRGAQTLSHLEEETGDVSLASMAAQCGLPKNWTTRQWHRSETVEAIAAYRALVLEVRKIGRGSFAIGMAIDEAAARMLTEMEYEWSGQ